jgi:hypothetical protein
MARSDPLVGRVLLKADTALTKFLVGAILAEYLNHWREKADGRAIRSAILTAAGLPPVSYTGLGLGGRLANSPFLKCLDSATIYGPVPAVSQVELCLLAIRLRQWSDIPSWRSQGEAKQEPADV